jgi:hypothetical protein
MTATHCSTEKPIIVCEMNASAGAEALLEAAISYCRDRNAELVVVWVLDPVLFQSPFPGSTGGPGAWGLVGARSRMLELARSEGIVASTVFRTGEQSRVLEEERRAFRAEKIFTSSDIPVRRCPLCGARDDPRAVHFCPRAHRTQARAA